MATTSTSSIRSVLVTGASTGIGAACALALAGRGWRVFAGVRREDDGRRLVERASGAALRPVLIDVTDEASIAATAKTISDATGGRLEGLVNNAGIAVPGPIEAVPMADVRRQIDVNLIGQIAVTQAMLPLLRAAGGARIVNIGSVSGRIASPCLGLYAASKFGLEAISDSLRVELRRWNIAVSIVEPGCVVTPIWDKAEKSGDSIRQDARPELLALYADDLDAFEAATLQMASRGIAVEDVARTVLHALTARRPKIRYPIPADTRWTIAICKLLPDRVVDWLVRRSLGLS